MTSSSTEAAPSPSSFGNLDLLLDTQARPDRRWWTIFSISFLTHLISFGIFMTSPGFIPQVALRPEPKREVVKLYLPPQLLTQKAPNRSKPTPSIDVASLLSPQPAQAHSSAPAPSIRRFEMPSPTPIPKAPPRALPQAPVISSNAPTAGLPPAAVSGLPQPAVPPPSAAANQPFQNLGQEGLSDVPKRKIAIPNSSVQTAVQSLTQHTNGTHIVVSDQNQSQPATGSPGAVGSGTAPHTEVELQSDPEGADFRNYLAQILTLVRANWRRVLPESARMGVMRGQTVIEFIINRDGSIPKLVTADESGSTALDQAAVAGLSMSNPLPPLPPDFKGQQVRLAFTFSVEGKR